MRQVFTFLVVFLVTFSVADVAWAYIPGISEGVDFILEAGHEGARAALALCGIGICVGVAGIARGNPSGWTMIFGCVIGVLIVLYWPDAQHHLEQKKGF